ncbi:MAG: TonB-dependent receptor plug domain-containing protein [bacterium]
MFKKSSLCWSIMIVCLYYFLSLSAEAKNVYCLDPIIISADRLSQPITESTGSVTIITKEDLIRKRPHSADEILRGMPGIVVNSSGTMGESISIRLRGSTSYQTMVLLDGMKVNSPWNGAFGKWGATELTDIGRIEVIRGTQSELYGSEAMGGVIHLFTKEGGGEPSTTLSLSGGSFRTCKEYLELAGEVKRLNYFLSATQTNSQGQFDNDAYRNTSLGTRIQWQAGHAFSFKTVGRYRDSMKGCSVNPDEFSFLDPNQHQRRFFWDKERTHKDRFFLHTVAIEGDPLTWWRYRLNMGIVQDDRIFREGLYHAPSNLLITDIVSDRFTVGTQHDFSWSALPNTLSLGLEYEHEGVEEEMKLEGDPNAIVKSITIQDRTIDLTELFNPIDKARHNISLFFQNRIEAHPLIFTAGFRWDNNSAYGEFVSPRISQAIHLDQTKTCLKASWAQGFRAPAFQELYLPLLGNPNLKPEKNTSFELGVQQLYGDTFSIETTYFHNSYRDQIVKHIIRDTKNISASTAEGIEVALAYQVLPQLDFQIFYTYLDSEDKEDGHELPDRPHHTCKLSAHYRHGGFSMHPVIQTVSSEYFDYDALDLQGNPLKTRNPGYTRVDVTFRYNIPVRTTKGRQWNCYIRINNLFDEDYYEVQGFPVPGINVMVGLTGTL